MIPWFIVATLVSAEPTARVTLNEFRTELAQPLAATWNGAQLRKLLSSLSDARRVAILIDRRIDPDAVIKLTVSTESLSDGLAQIAAAADALVSLPNNVVYIGPADAAHWLQTTIAAREAGLGQAELAISERRQLDISARKTHVWQDLDTPRDIVQRIAESYDLEIRGTDALPHDLWAAGTLPLMTAAEALTLVLIQFDLDFDWLPEGRGIKLRPWREPNLIERRYKPRGKSPNTALATWQDRWPLLEPKLVEGFIVIRGRVEDHAAIAAWLNPGSTPKATSQQPAHQVPLQRRRFTLQVEHAKIRALMANLEQNGVVFHYDRDAFLAAGIDFDMRVSFNARSVTADEYLALIFDPIQVTASYDNVTVTLKLREPAK